MKTCLGMVTYGNLPFTQLAVREIQATSTSPVEICVVVGKPGDRDTEAWLRAEGIAHLAHREENRGFPASLNDLYDECFGRRQADALIICGNDVVPYPGAVDALIATAETSNWEWIGASEYDVRALLREHPDQRRWFTGERHQFTDFSQRPWDAQRAAVQATPPGVEPHVLKDVHNLCLFKRSVARRIGYVDTNFFPAYFSDNDYCRRAWLAGVRGVGLPHAVYFHFWSRTIHQGSGGSTDAYFTANASFYRTKWGGDWGSERCETPFDGRPYALPNGVVLPAEINLAGRADESAIVRYWRERNQP